MKVPVLIPKIFNYPFTYISTLKSKLKEGDIVVVPFGKNLEIGVVWDKLHETEKKIKFKEIQKRVENFSINKSLIKFINWFSMYNLTSKGKVLKMCLGNEKNIVLIKDKILSNKFSKKTIFNLNEEQKKVLSDLKNFGDKFSVSVLQGITGSGKTLVYFERIKELINNNKQALVLLPEIFLTNQFKERFLEYFGFEPDIWHSKITPKNKRIIWKGIIDNKIKLVIGARSSLLLPFKKLGLIVVDEEHDSSYKQDDGTIYNARNMAISRASIENIPIHLVTSIPSVETYNNIKNKKYRHTKISERFNNFPLPETKIVNLNINKVKNKYIADETIGFIKKFLTKKEQILFFINRRGYAPFIICKKCGYKNTCPDCSIYLTFHNSKNKAVCHHCGYEKNISRKCKNNKFCDFIMYGPGVEKIFEEIKKVFPDKIIKIFSSDFMKKKRRQKNYLKKLKKMKLIF